MALSWRHLIEGLVETGVLVRLTDNLLMTGMSFHVIWRWLCTTGFWRSVLDRHADRALRARATGKDHPCRDLFVRDAAIVDHDDLSCGFLHLAGAEEAEVPAGRDVEWAKALRLGPALGRASDLSRARFNAVGRGLFRLIAAITVRRRNQGRRSDQGGTGRRQISCHSICETGAPLDDQGFDHFGIIIRNTEHFQGHPQFVCHGLTELHRLRGSGRGIEEALGSNRQRGGW